MGALRLVALLALASTGGFLLVIGGLVSYSPGFYSVPPLVILIMLAGVLTLLGAAVMGLLPPRPVSTSQGQKKPMTGIEMPVAGILITAVALFIAFPVGCNLTSSCPADPAGTWSTIWPNVLALGLGVTCTAWGFGRTRSYTLRGFGIGLVVSGTISAVLGNSIGYFTSCPGNGCPPLTMSQWWTLFWPDVAAEAVGISLIVTGVVLIFVTRRRPPTGVATR